MQKAKEYAGTHMQRSGGAQKCVYAKGGVWKRAYAEGTKKEGGGQQRKEGGGK